MATKYESADLILKLYELRREETMRKARDWFIVFNPSSAGDVLNAVMSEHDGYYRMVASYWDMAASFVNHGAIDEQMFNDSNNEHVCVFSKLEPFIAEIRSLFKEPEYLHHLEQLVMRMPDAQERLAKMRKRLLRLASAIDGRELAQAVTDRAS